METRARVKILTVDPAKRRIEGMLKDGAAVQVVVLDIPPAFMWPKEGEHWIVERNGYNWMLVGRFDDRKDAFPIENLALDQARVNAQEVFDSKGRRLVAVPNPKPVVTGSRGGNTALASLLTQLATLGVITDSTTA